MKIDFKMFKSKQAFKSWVYTKWINNSEVSVLFYKSRLWYMRNFGKFKENYTILGDKISLADYNIVIDDNFQGDKLDRSLWRDGQNWGKVHPTHPEQYSSREAFKVSAGTIKFWNKYAPKVVHQYVGTEHYQVFYPKKGECLYAHGDISVKAPVKTFTFGVFEIRCILPNGVLGWPAFWLGMDGKEEIDFFEFFGKNQSDKKLVQTTTVHWPSGSGEDYPKGGSMSAKKYRLPISATHKMNTYTFVWIADQIIFMFNGIVIRKVTRKSIVKRYREKEARLNVGTGIYYGDLPETPGPIPMEIFEVDYIKVWQQK